MEGGHHPPTTTLCTEVMGHGLIQGGSQPVILLGPTPTVLLLLTVLVVEAQREGKLCMMAPTPQEFPAHLGHFKGGGEEQGVKHPPGGGENPPPQQRHHAFHDQGGKGSGVGGVGQGQENQGPPPCGGGGVGVCGSDDTGDG